MWLPNGVWFLQTVKYRIYVTSLKDHSNVASLTPLTISCMDYCWTQSNHNARFLMCLSSVTSTNVSAVLSKLWLQVNAGESWEQHVYYKLSNSHQDVCVCMYWSRGWGFSQIKLSIVFIIAIVFGKFQAKGNRLYTKQWTPAWKKKKSIKM